MFHISPWTLNKREPLNIKSRRTWVGGAGMSTGTIRKS
jgi:hypothetical protein